MTISTDQAGEPPPSSRPPEVPWSVRRKLDALRRFHLGGEWARDEVGHVATIALGPQRLGPMLAPRFVLVSSARGARDVLARKDGAIDKYGAIHEELRKFGPNSFNMSRSEWLPRRRALQPVFTPQRVTSYAAEMGAVVDDKVSVWAAEGHLDIQAATQAFTTEVLGRSLLDMSLGERAPQLASDFRYLSDYMLARAQRPVTAPVWLPTPARAKYRASRDRLLAVANEAIDRTRRDPDLSAPLIRQLLAATDPQTGRGLSEDDLAWELVTFIVAGHDTTATVLAYSLWQLGRHPQIQAAVAEEAAALGARTLQPSDIDFLPLTVRILHEAMRLCPPAPAVARQARVDVEVDGFAVPRGWNIILNLYALHRDPAAWDKPEEFDPDRFLPERSHSRDRWQYLPFGGGQRSCVGDHFAMLESTIALATLVRDLEIVSLGEFEIEVGVTSHSACPVLARVTRRPPKPVLG